MYRMIYRQLDDHAIEHSHSADLLSRYIEREGGLKNDHLILPFLYLGIMFYS
jgi:hypothetical protein